VHAFICLHVCLNVLSKRANAFLAACEASKEVKPSTVIPPQPSAQDKHESVQNSGAADHFQASRHEKPTCSSCHQCSLLAHSCRGYCPRWPPCQNKKKHAHFSGNQLAERVMPHVQSHEPGKKERCASVHKGFQKPGMNACLQLLLPVGYMQPGVSDHGTPVPRTAPLH